MAAIILGLFVFVLGSTGISNALTLNKNYGWNKRLDPYRYNNFDFQHYRDEFGAPDYSDYGRSNVLTPYNNYGWNDRLNPFPKHHPWYKFYNRNNNLHGEIPDLKVNTNENMNIVNSGASFKATVSSQDNTTKRRIIEFLVRYNRRSSTDKSGNPTQPNANSESNNLSTSSEAVNFHVTDRKIPTSKISAPSIKATTPTRTILNSDISLKKHGNLSKPDNVSSASMKKENFVDTMESSMEDKKVKNSSEFMPNTILKSDLAENSFVDKKKDQNQSMLSTQILEKSHTENTVTSSTERKNIENNSEFSTDAFTKSERVENSFIAKKQDRTDESRNDSMMLNLTTSEIERHNSTKKSSTQEHLLPNEENFEKESRMFSPTILTGEVSTSFDGKSNSAVDTQATNNQDAKLESTVSQSPPFSTNNEYISLKIKSSSSEGVNTRNIQNFETKSTTSQSSVAFKSDATASQSSSSFAIKSTSSETLKIESTTESFISSREKSPLFLFTDKVTEDSINKISFAESPFPKTQIKSDGIEKDHVIEIPSIRTARVVITSMFLVVALIASALLSVYLFRLRRREVQYDQVMLIS